jgi:hypothetical protein
MSQFMPKIIQKTLISLIIVVLATGSSLALAAPHPQETEFAATLEIYTEGVEVKRAETEQWLAVSGRAVVAAGDSIRTNETGEAIIIWFDDGTLVELRPNTEIVINAFNGNNESDQFVIETRIILGQVFHNVNRLLNQDSRYTVVTPTMQAAVRGTTFGVDVTGGAETTLVVGEGIVAVSQGENQHQVEAGFWMRASVPESGEPVAAEVPSVGSEATDNSEGTSGDTVEEFQVVALSEPAPFSEAGDDAVLGELISGVAPICVGTIDSPSSSPIRIYNFPTETAELIGTAALDQQIEVIALLADGLWAEIAWNGQVGWLLNENALLDEACRVNLPIVTSENPLPLPLRLRQ